MNWLHLTSSEQLKKLIGDNPNQNFAIFKHSTRCSISAAAKNRMEKNWEDNNPNTPVYYLDLLKDRELSNEIAEVFNVQHQSPQLLLICNGECIYNASHLSISPKDAAKAIS